MAWQSFLLYWFLGWVHLPAVLQDNNSMDQQQIIWIYFYPPKLCIEALKYKVKPQIYFTFTCSFFTLKFLLQLFILAWQLCLLKEFA